MSTELLQSVLDTVVQVGLRLLGAVAIWLVGRWLIRLAERLIQRALQRQHLDTTVSTYIGNAVGVLLNIALVVAILGFFGVETTTFAALLAAAGVAIGMAWSGLLAHFAAGIFIVVLRPFKVGDFVQAAGIIGTVREINLFVTAIDTMDNVRTIVGNAKVFGDTIQNFAANSFRRVDLKAQLAHGADHQRAAEILRAALRQIPNVSAAPAPDVEILDFTLAGPVLAVRPYCHNDHYWQVYFDTNRAIREELGRAGFSIPQTHHHVAQGT